MTDQKNKNKTLHTPMINIRLKISIFPVYFIMQNPVRLLQLI